MQAKDFCFGKPLLVTVVVTIGRRCCCRVASYKRNNERDRGVGGMSYRAAFWLAWSLWGLSLTLTVLALLLLALNLSHPHTHTFDSWLDSTLNAVFFSTVGAIVASRRPENPVGWLLAYLLWARASPTSVRSTPSTLYWPNPIHSPQAKRWPGSLPGSCSSQSASRYSIYCCSPPEGYQVGAGGG